MAWVIDRKRLQFIERVWFSIGSMIQKRFRPGVSASAASERGVIKWATHDVLLAVKEYPALIRQTSEIGSSQGCTFVHRIRICVTCVCRGFIGVWFLQGIPRGFANRHVGFQV